MIPKNVNMSALVKQQKFLEIDMILHYTNVALEPIGTLVTFLRLTYPIRRYLRNWKAFLLQSQAVEKRRSLDCDKLFVGLS